MHFIYPDWTVPRHVRALSTTRIGGISQAPFDSLNLGAHVNDDFKHVVANRQALIKRAELPGEPHWINQVHGTTIIKLSTPEHQRTKEIIDADGAVTRETNTVCAILTADCMPVLLTNKTGNCVAAVHAGWRGLAGGILELAISAMDCSPEQVTAWAGPCIGASAFEIGLEVREQLGGPDSAYQVVADNKVCANLVQLAKLRLREAGVTAFSASHLCTYTNKDFFSYRRDGQCGRMATLIWMEST